MTKVNSPAIITREALPDAPDGEWLSTLLDAKNGFDDQVGRTLRNGITIGDNTTWKFVDVNLQHNVELEIKNPFDDQSVQPASVTIVKCVGIVTDAVTGKPTGSTYKLSHPVLDWRPTGKPSNSVFVSARYFPPSGKLQLSKTANQSVNDTTVTGSTDIIWESVDSNIGDGFSFTPGTANIICNYAGLIEAHHTTRFMSVASTEFLITRFNLDALGTQYGELRLPDSNPNGASSQSMTTFVSVPRSLEGTTLRLNVAHRNTGSLPRNVAANLTFSVFRYVEPDPGVTGRVTLLFMGE